MNVQPPEKRRVKVTAGALPSPKITSLAACHPFSQQVDVVFPSNPRLLSRLENLETSYGKGKASLLQVVNAAQGFVNPVEGESSLLAMSATAHDEDAWCIDPRGHLTLSVGKETYERLGLVGQKIPYKGYEGRHIIDVPLKKNALSPAMLARVKTGLEGWQQRRSSEMQSEGGTWDVVYCTADRTPSQNQITPFNFTQTYRVIPTKHGLKDIHVPVPELSARPSAKAQSKKKKAVNSEMDVDSQAEAVEDWDRRTESLFEWVGLACLGAQRLDANDRVDPYVALFDPPEPSRIENVTHLRWRGLLAPSFVKEIIDIIINELETDPSSPSPLPFASITAHALSASPVSYIPYAFTAGTDTIPAALQTPTKIPAKVPRVDGEDTWCAIFERSSGRTGSAKGGGGVRWCLGESLGRLDARWG